MTFAELLEAVGDEPVFEPGLLTAGPGRRSGLAGQLVRWCAAGRLHQLRRGLYALAPPYRKTIPHPFLVANRLAPGSYVSGVSALAVAGAVPEHAAEVTSVGPVRTKVRDTPLGRYSFRRVKSEMLFGYRRTALGEGQHAFVATPEKAFLDLVYLQPRGNDPAWIDGLRLDTHVISIDALESAAAEVVSPKLGRAVRHVRALTEDPALAYEELDE